MQWIVREYNINLPLTQWKVESRARHLTEQRKTQQRTRPLED